MDKPSVQGFFGFGDEIIRENPGLLLFVLSELAAAFLWGGTVIQGLMVLSLIVLFAYMLGAYLRIPPMAIRGIRTVDVIAELAFVGLFLLQLFPENTGNWIVIAFGLFALPFAFILMSSDRWVSRIWIIQGLLFLAAVFAALTFTGNRSLDGLALFILGAQNLATGLYYENVHLRRLLPTLIALVIALLGILYRIPLG